MRLLLVELTRLRSRRAVVLILVATGLLAAVVAGTTIWATRPVSAADRAAAQARAEQDARQPAVRIDLARCRKDPQLYLGDPKATAGQCAERILPRAEWYLGRSQLSLGQEVDNTGIGALLMLAIAVTIAASTFAGADWASGSMSNQLLFEPRRGRIWLAKGGAVLLAGLLVSAVVVAGFWLTLYTAAQLRGIDPGPRVLRDVYWAAVRGVLLAGLAGLGGYAVTMLVRHTVGTVGLLFGYVVFGEFLVALLPFERVGRWSPANNVFAWLGGGYRYFDSSVDCSGSGNVPCDQMSWLSFPQAAAYLGALLLLVAVPSLLLFRRRDIE